MISLDALNLFLSISEQELIDELILVLLASPQLAIFLDKFPGLKNALMRDMPRWKTTMLTSLKNTQAPPELEQEFRQFQQCQTCNNSTFNQQLPELLNSLEQQASPFASEGRKLVENSGKAPLSTAQRTLFMQRWRLSLTLQTLSLNQELLDQEREKLLTELQQRLALSGQLAPVLGEDDASAGRLWDMSRGYPQRSDYQLIIQYGDFLARQPELLALAEQLGRCHEARSRQVEEAPLETFHQRVKEPASVPEEVRGIHQSDDILRLLPAELAMLGISELETEFYRRLIEKRLLTYQLQGEAWHNQEVWRPARHHQHQEQPRGPFIICVDTSGSMGGFNEHCAKAFCLALLKVALSDRRRCVLMLFAHEVIRYELTADDGISQAIRFLGQHFRGGTDIAACLKEVLAQASTPDWRKADTVVISDFIAQRLPEKVVAQVQHHQVQLQQHFHAVAMSCYGKPGILRIFNHIWQFDTNMKSRLMRRWKRY